jgi:hypothetical protein
MKQARRFAWLVMPWVVTLGAMLWRTGAPQGETTHVSPISVQDS